MFDPAYPVAVEGGEVLFLLGEVAVFPQDGGEPGVERGIHLPAIAKADLVGQQVVQGDRKNLGGYALVAYIEMRDLPYGMHPGIGPP